MDTAALLEKRARKAQPIRTRISSQSISMNDLEGGKSSAVDRTRYSGSNRMEKRTGVMGIILPDVVAAPGVS